MSEFLLGVIWALMVGGAIIIAANQVECIKELQRRVEELENQ